MKKYLLSIALIFFLDIEIKAHVDHYSNYNYLEYELFRNNKLIGYHKYEFERDGNNLVINNEVNFKITKLGVDLYKYYAESIEKYKDGKFFSFASKTNQNKKEKYVNIKINESVRINTICINVFNIYQLIFASRILCMCSNPIVLFLLVSA